MWGRILLMVENRSRVARLSLYPVELSRGEELYLSR